MTLNQGDIIEWVNSESSQIVWMICEDSTTGIVIHSDGLIRIGTLTYNISELPNIKKFKGTVNINSN